MMLLPSFICLSWTKCSILEILCSLTICGEAIMMKCGPWFQTFLIPPPLYRFLLSCKLNSLSLLPFTPFISYLIPSTVRSIALPSSDLFGTPSLSLTCYIGRKVAFKCERSVAACCWREVMLGGRRAGRRMKSKTRAARERDRIVYLSNTVLFSLAGWYSVRHLCFSLLIITYHRSVLNGGQENLPSQVFWCLCDYTFSCRSVPSRLLPLLLCLCDSVANLLFSVSVSFDLLLPHILLSCQEPVRQSENTRVLSRWEIAV